MEAAMIQVSEQKLNEAILVYRQMNHDEPSGMLNAKAAGEEFRKVGLTPFYILNGVTGEVFTTSEEMMNGQFH